MASGEGVAGVVCVDVGVVCVEFTREGILEWGVLVLEAPVRRSWVAVAVVVAAVSVVAVGAIVVVRGVAEDDSGEWRAWAVEAVGAGSSVRL